MKQQHSALTHSTQAHTPRTVDTGADATSETRRLLAESSVGNRRRILWIDGIGGFLLVDRPEIVLGQATSGSPVDVAIVGDLSRQACVLRQAEGDTLLQPLQEMHLNGRVVERPQLLRSGAELQFGRRVKLKFTQPNPLSATARLDMLSLNRFKPHVDGVLLLRDSCVLGPASNSHVVCPDWKTELLLFKHLDQWHFRTLDEVDVNGETCRGQVPLVAGMRMRGEDFSLSVE
ncbi:MAG: hypothetical protein R3C53_11820 [Pirellulaceae bacterium]